MSVDWIETPLDSVAAVTVGFVGTMASQYRSKGIPFLRSQNVDRLRLDLSELKYIDEDFNARLQKSELRPGDVVTVRTGKPGTTAVVPDDLPIANCSDLVITRPGPELDARWLAYYINGAAAGYVSSRLVGAVQQHFNVRSAKEMLLRLPPIEEQREIAATLGALDDKIALNRVSDAHIAELLDALSEQACAGLRRVPLREIASLERQTTDPKRLGENFVDHFSLPAFDDGAVPERVFASSIMSNKQVVTRQSILLSRLNPRFNRTWWVEPREGIAALASTEFAVIAAGDNETLAGLWFAVRDPHFRDELARRVTGTSGSHQRVRPDDLLAIDVPDVRRLPLADRQRALLLLELRTERRRENTRLRAIRDDLIPELLSGRIRVSYRSEERA